MRKVFSVLVAFVAISSMAIGQANADFTFGTLPGPFNVPAGAGPSINLNNAGNSAGVTSDLYGSFTVTSDWVAGGGGPWSSEAEITMTTAAGSTNIDPPTSGQASNGDPTTLTFSGFLAGVYDPDVDGSLDLLLEQSFGGSDADWSNIAVTLFTFAGPPTPVATLNLAGGPGAMDSYSGAHSANSITWLELIYDGNAGSAGAFADTFTSDFDTELGLYDASGNLLVNNDDTGGLQSMIDLTPYSAGTYYLAVGGFNTTFGPAVFGATGGAATGNLNVTVGVAIPEPASIAILGLATVGLFVRRRR